MSRPSGPRSRPDGPMDRSPPKGACMNLATMLMLAALFWLITAMGAVKLIESSTWPAGPNAARIQK